jgi:hypothetical protein
MTEPSSSPELDRSASGLDNRFFAIVLCLFILVPDNIHAVSRATQ